MNPQISEQDWMIISSYLDGQLDQVEREALEKRLSSDENLRREFESLRQTRMVMRSLPLRGVPHNFFLTHAMLQPKPILRFVPFLNFASAIAAFFFVVSLVFGGFRLGALVPLRAAPAIEKAAAPEMNRSLTPTEIPPIIIWEPSVPNAQGMGGGPQTNTIPQAAAGEMAITPAPLLGGGAPPTETPQSPPPLSMSSSTEQPSGLGMSPTQSAGATLAPLAPSSDQTMPAATPTAGIVAEGTNPILGLNPGGEAPTEPALKSTAPDQNQTSSQTFFPYLQIGLALFAAAAALAAFLIRRSMR